MRRRNMKIKDIPPNFNRARKRISQSLDTGTTFCHDHRYVSEHSESVKQMI